MTMAGAEFTDDSFRNFEPVDHCWFLTGPTASGKTSIGLALAERLDAEIISLDSMAVYVGMDIGTAKPSPADCRRVPHYLIDLVTPDQEYSLSQYVAAAHAAIETIRAKGRQVLFVGGTPLYLKSLLRGVYPGPPADWEFRRQIEAELQEVDVHALHTRLQQVDPLSAARLHPHDKRRIIRALEVHRLTGQPLSHQQVHFDDAHPERGSRVVTLSWPREHLHARIEARVEQMFAAGWLEEVRGLLDRYGTLGRTASQAVGYREIIAHLLGQLDLSALGEQVKTRTRRFARRQDTWFRSLSECRRLDPSDAQSPSAIAERIVNLGWGDGVMGYYFNL
jgi:tRNA dimethylallyltransferase